MDYYIKEKNWSPENFIISSFNWDELRAMRKMNGEVAIAVLTEEDPTDAVPVAKELNAAAINPYFKNLNLEVANEIRDAGFKIYTWTVNEPADIDAMKRIGVDGIITNYPERVR
jgi:glycerophosphoryl diester phosphodiesterase